MLDSLQLSEVQFSVNDGQFNFGLSNGAKSKLETDGAKIKTKVMTTC
jgi:hypothetical protein